MLLELHKGEIVGLCGLSDAGILEVAEAVFGVRPLVAGDITLTRVIGKFIPTPWQWHMGWVTYRKIRIDRP